MNRLRRLLAGFHSATASAASLWCSPLGKILAFAALLRTTGLGWGMPGTDGWDDDGVAPRDFLIGVVDTVWPGHHYIYPPLHLMILTVATAPIWVARLLTVPSFEPSVLVHHFIQVPTMTAMAIVARLVSVGLSIGLLWNVAKIGETIGGTTRAGAWAAAACTANAVLTYYSQTTNLDLPYLFWSVLAVRWFVTALAEHESRLLRRVPIAAALAVATKDQAYALFIFGFPAALVLWFALDEWARSRARSVFLEVGIGLMVATGVLLVVDGALVNPTGFLERLRTLLGTASQDHAYYPTTWTGRLDILRDVALGFRQNYPVFLSPLVPVGIVVAARARDPGRRAAGLAPLLFAISFTVAFNMTVRRTEQRFVLPQSIAWGLYIGLALDAIHRVAARRLGRPRMAPSPTFVFWAAVSPCFVVALFGCLAVDAAMVLDPRYDAEAWMRTHIAPSARVELYGNDVHLPRLPAGGLLTRIDVTPLETRNPLPGVEEVRDAFSNIEARKPAFVVVSAFWASKYLLDPDALTQRGRVVTPEQAVFEKDEDSRSFFRSLLDGRLHYRWAHLSGYRSRVWPRVDIHASLTREIWIFERTEPAGEPPASERHADGPRT
ncbi:MAG: hypothetical protein ABSC94_26095 [Polyangiaceae bacterium]